MASTISTVNEALVDDKVVEALRYVMPMLNSFSLGITAEGKIQSDVVYVPIATDPTVASKTAGTIVSATGTVAGTSVTLSNFYGAGWDVNEGRMSSRLLPSYWADKAAGAVYVLAKQVVDAALALITASNYSDTDDDKLSVAPGDFGLSDVALLWEKAETKIKQRQRSLGLNAAYAAAVMGESNVALVYSNTGNNFVQSGIVPQMIGMNTWAYGAFPSNSENLGGAVFGKAAILVGVAPPDQILSSGEGDIIERRLITEPDSGITAMYTSTATAGGNLAGEVALLYGVAKGQNAVVRLVTA